MVGMMSATSAATTTTVLYSIQSSKSSLSKIHHLRHLKELLLNPAGDPSLLPHFLPRITQLHSEASPVRRFLASLIGEIGLKNVQLLPDMVPTLLTLLKDDTPAVARQAITTGTHLFRHVLHNIVIQGLHCSGIDESLKLSWTWILEFKTSVFPMTAKARTDGIRLLAVKFVEALVLLYTPDPEVSADLPQEAGSGFNISWLKGGHPLLNVGDLAMEASHSLQLLLEQLKFPQVKSLSNSMIIVLINSLSAIARRRPSFYGRILPVLLCLDPATSIIKGVQVPGAHHALKNAFVACLNCTHLSAAPWRDRLVEALKAMHVGGSREQAITLDKFSSGMAHIKEESLSTVEDKVLLEACDEAQNSFGRKRYTVQESTDLSQDDAISGKRLKPSPLPSQEIIKEPIQTNHASTQEKVLLIDTKPFARNEDSEPVQQLVGMFGALVAQGDKAAESLEIIISSIPPNLLAEVVMANIYYLPPTRPQEEGAEESITSMSCASSSANKNMPHMQPSALVSDAATFSNAFPLIASLFNVQPSVSHEIVKVHQTNEVKVELEEDITLESCDVDPAVAASSTSIPASIVPIQLETEKITPIVRPYGDNAEVTVGGIPGLESSNSFDEVQESLDASGTSTSELQGTSQEHDISLGNTLPLDISSSSCMKSYTSEIPSPRMTVSDASQAACTPSLIISAPYILPKMTVPDVHLTDEQRDNLQKRAFVRIIEAYKQITVSGASHAHLSLLAYLAIEFPLDLDPWVFLQKHIFSDYVNNEGHELTLRVLYRLYRETEQDQDFFSSTTATSIYETFLLTVAETLRDTFPASDKSLGRLLVEVPYLSDGVLKLLERLCCPESKEKHDKDFQSGDRVTQGLSAVWNLILLRPSSRDRCLQIALESAVHHMEEVRMKAIRLVANKLFPMSSLSKKIEDFAAEKLHSVVEGVSSMECIGDDGSTPGLEKGSYLERPSSAGQLGLVNNELTSDSHLAPNTTSSISEAQRCMSLHFALCTKKHSLLRQIFSIYGSIPMAAKQAVHRHIPILIRTIGSSAELLGIISDLPNGSKGLLMQVLQTLTDGTLPSRELISSVRRLYNSKLKDVEIFVPLLASLSKDEVLPIFPQLVNLPLEKFQDALVRLLQGLPPSAPSLTPAEVLIAIHAIDPEKDGIPLKKVTDACSACFEQRQVFTQQVLAKVLNQLVEQIPLPMLFMRTVIQTVNMFPALVDFVMEILSRLISKQIWKYPKLWVGFLKCLLQTRPQSFNVCLQLPATQLENALNKYPGLKTSLVEHANQPDVRSTLPRSTLVVLGLVTDPQASNQVHTSQNQATETTSSAADVMTEVTQESGVVR